MVDRIRKQLPSVRASIPADNKLETLVDLTTTIRASVSDVERTLILSTILVVAVVFVFLRSPRGTLIPAVAVTLSLIGTFGVMYLAGFSLDNLSLMALTISTGFVVDDAIVVMENVARHIEDGMQPREAALKGAGEVAFTVLSMSLSLIAVFVPILFMGGLVGRLFHEFACTLATAIVVSLIISLTVTPMMCAYILRREQNETHGQLYRFSERTFNFLQEGYRRSLSWTLRHPAVIITIFLLTFLLNGFLLVHVPKGLFPLQDTGVIAGGIQGPQDASFNSMVSSLKDAERIIQDDPAVQSVAGFTGGQGGPGGGASNAGFLFMSLKPLNVRKISAAAALDRLRPKLAALPGASTFLHPVQDLTVGARQGNGAYQYQLSADTVDQLGELGPKVWQHMLAMPQIKDVNTDQQNNGLQILLDYDRSTAARLGATPQLINNSLYFEFGESQVATIYSKLNQYYVVLEAAPQFYKSPTTLDSTFVHTSGRGSVPLAAIATKRVSTSPLTVNHTAFFPSVAISFNLASGVSLSQATDAINQMQQRIGMPTSIRAQFAGTAQAFQRSLSSEPVLIVAALLAIYTHGPIGNAKRV